MDIGGKLLSRLIVDGNIVAYHKCKLADQYFIGEEAELYKFVDTHVGKYGKLPTMETVKAKFGTLPKAPEPVEYYFDKTEERFRFRTMNAALKDANELMKVQDVGTAIMQVDEAVSRIKYSSIRRSIMDFGKEGFDQVLGHYWATILNEQEPGLWFGWDKFDAQCEGLGDGDLVSVVGRPASGKTMLTLNSPLFTWRYKRGRPLYVSMEMPTLEINQRMVAMYAPWGLKMIQSSNIGKYGLSQLTKKMKSAREFENEFYVVDGSLIDTAEDIQALVQMLRPTSVVIDSAYLLGHKDKRLKKGERIDANAEFLVKHVYRKFGIPGYHSYQLNRDAAKKITKGKQEEVGIDDIYYSDAIGQLSSIVLGLFQQESVETMNRRLVSVLKGRRGQVGEFPIAWDFLNMNFSELPDENEKAQHKMQFV